MATILESEMLNYFTQLDEAEKKSVVQMLKTFIKGRKGNNHQTLEQYNQELIEAEKEYLNGDYSSHEDFLKSIKGW